MADHSKPTTTSTYVNFVSELDGRLDDISLGLDPATTSPTNLATNAIRWTSASNKWQKYNGTTWADLSSAYSININGTVGATTPASGAFTTLSATGNVTLGDASGDTVTINGTVGAGVVISGSTATDALRITQTGAGNALVVEDSTNPDSTPFVVDSSGITIVGGTTSIGAGQTTNIQSQSTGGSAGVSAFRFSNDTIPPRIQVGKSRGTTVGSYTAVQSGDSLGGLYFYGADGTNIVPQGASIIGQVDGTVSTGSVAGRIIFSTTLTGETNPTERMRIDSSGNVGIGASPSYQLDVSGTGVVRINPTTGTNQATLFAQNTGGNFYFGKNNSAGTSYGTDAYASVLWSSGAYPMVMATNGTERMRIRSDGNVSIGGTGSAAVSLYIQKPTTGAVTAYGIIAYGTVQNDVTASAHNIQSQSNIASGTTLTNYSHFRATEGTISGTITNQYGFVSVSDLVSATNNYGFWAQSTAAVGAGKAAYGFYSSVNTATGGGTTYGFYAAGTADNYFAGKVTTAKGTTGYPAFSAYASASQTITSATITKVAINTEHFDTNSNFDPTTNYRFTPTVEGYYQVNGSVRGNATTTFTSMSIYIYKNGSIYKRAQLTTNYTTSASTVQISDVIYMNGSTDYIELYANVNGTGTITIDYSAATQTSFFSACLVRGA